MKNIYLIISESVRIRDLLRLGTLDYLLEDPEVRVVLVTPAARDPDFLREFARDRVAVRYLKRFSFSRTYRAVRMALWALRSRRLLDIWAWLEKQLRPGTMYEDLFQEFPPSVVVLTDPIKEREVPLALNAQRRGVPTLGLIRSWDNILKRLPVRTRVFAVPNEVNRREAIGVEMYRESEVKVVGMPQFDPYFQQGVIRPRAEFLGNLGLDPGKRLIVLATAGAKLEYVQSGWLDALLEAQENGGFAAPTQMVCRNHSGDVLGPFLNYEGRPGLLLDMRRGWLKSLGWTMTRQDVEYVANLLKHADVVVTPGSTITLEAAIFDTPTVVVAYNDYLPEVTENVLINYTFNLHFKPLVQQKLVPIAYSKEEMVSWVSRLLREPQLFRKERRRIVELWVKPSDGSSSRRLADLILEMAGHDGGKGASGHVPAVTASKG